MASLLGVDLGLRTGLALYGDDGRLRWYRSRNYGSASRLKRAVWSELSQIPDLAHVVLEGDANLARVWAQAASKRGAGASEIHAHTWRRVLLKAREQRSGADAKRHAATLARRIIDHSDARQPTSLRHDAAEAIAIGWWGCMELGWVRGDELGQAP